MPYPPDAVAAMRTHIDAAKVQLGFVVDLIYLHNRGPGVTPDELQAGHDLLPQLSRIVGRLEAFVTDAGG